MLVMVGRVNNLGSSRKDKAMMLAVKKVPCAWCPMEEPQEGSSHGICETHDEQMRTQSAQRQFDKIPSYVGERKAFEAYKERRRK
jgi:hypothetical protein